MNKGDIERRKVLATKYFREADGNITNSGIAQKIVDSTDENNKDVVRRWVSNFRRDNLDGKDFTEVGDIADEIGVEPNKIKEYWYKGKHYSIRVKGDIFDPEKFTEDIVGKVKSYAPKIKPLKRVKSDDPHCLVIDPADIHIGKLAYAVETGEDYNSEIAVQRVTEGVEGILQKSSGFDIEKILLVVGNDILHVDSPRNQTTSGTPQDTDGLWHRMFDIAVELYTSIIEKLLAVAPVDIVFNPSNHDFQSGWMLARVIDAFYSKTKEVTVDHSIKHRKYYKYGNSLIGTTHGDGAKEKDIPLLMATESGQYWVDCPYRYFYLHHIHSKKRFNTLTTQDDIGVTVEYVRSPTGPDRWHYTNGYVGAPKAIEGYIHSKYDGQVSRLSHYFK